MKKINEKKPFNQTKKKSLKAIHGFKAHPFQGRGEKGFFFLVFFSPPPPGGGGGEKKKNSCRTERGKRI